MQQQAERALAERKHQHPYQQRAQSGVLRGNAMQVQVPQPSLLPGYPLAYQPGMYSLTAGLYPLQPQVSSINPLQNLPYSDSHASEYHHPLPNVSSSVYPQPIGSQPNSIGQQLNTQQINQTQSNIQPPSKDQLPNELENRLSEQRRTESQTPYAVEQFKEELAEYERALNNVKRLVKGLDTKLIELKRWAGV